MRVLWVRLRSLGDILVNLPALDLLKRLYPHAHVTYVVQPEYAEILRDYPYIDRLAVIPRRWASYAGILLRRWPWLRDSYDWVINFHGGKLSGIITFWAHARAKVGLERFRFQFIYTHRVDDRLVGRPLHTVEVQARMLSPLIGNVSRNLLRKPTFPVMRRPPRPRVLAFLQWRGDRPFVLVHPGARFRWKRWPYERTLELLQTWLARWPTIAFGIFAGPCERDLAPWLRDWPSNRVYRIEQWPLSDVIQLLMHTDIYVGFDNGITHLAAMVGCPLVVMWGPVDPSRWAPWTDMQIRLHYPHQPIDVIPDEAVTQAVQLMLEATLYGTDRFHHIASP